MHIKKKLTLSSGMLLPDPHVLVNWKNDVSMMPDITWGDMYNYLINSPSNFTHDSIKAYKSLESYKFYICGHVQDVYYNLIEEKNQFCFIKSEVSLHITKSTVKLTKKKCLKS